MHLCCALVSRRLILSHSQTLVCSRLGGGVAVEIDLTSRQSISYDVVVALVDFVVVGAYSLKSLSLKRDPGSCDGHLYGCLRLWGAAVACVVDLCVSADQIWWYCHAISMAKKRKGEGAVFVQSKLVESSVDVLDLLECSSAVAVAAVVS